MKEGDSVKFVDPLEKSDGHFWYNIRIATMSFCGRYAKVCGEISWGKDHLRHEFHIETAKLQLKGD